MSAPSGRPRPSVIFDTLLNMVFRTALVFSAFLLFSGHNQPGGGFVGGLVASVALVLRYVAGGADEVDRVVSWDERTVLGLGLLIAAGTGMAGWVFGDAFLYAVEVDAHVPLLGELHATSALPFDVGVYVVVIGLGLSVLRSLGKAADEDLDHTAAEDPPSAAAEDPA